MSTQTLSALRAVSQPVSPPGTAPEWLRLFPKAEAFAADRRKRFFYDDAAAVIEATFAAEGRVHVDIDHSSLPGRKGGDTRAYGYVTGMEEREDGLWGRIDWTAAGAALMEDRAYWGVSPVLAHDEAGRISRVISVALTNGPALRQLTALTTTEEGYDGMEFLKKLAGMLGLPEDASEDAVMGAIKKMQGGEDKAAMTALTAVGEALGLDGTATTEELVAQVAALRAGTGEAAQQLAALTAEVKVLKDGEKKRAAEAFVDAAIAAKRAGVTAAREHYVALHMENPDRAAALVAGLPILGETGLTAAAPKAGEQLSALTAEQKTIADALGLTHETYLASLQADAKARETV